MSEGRIDTKADATLRRMSDYMNGLRSFRVEGTTIDEKITTDGEVDYFEKLTKVNGPK